MALVRCEIRAGADSIENGTCTSFYVPLPVTRARVAQMFPYEGSFHFRVKVSGKTIGVSHSDALWLDLTNDNDELPVFDEIKGETHVQALALRLPEVIFNLENEDHLETEINEDLSYLEVIGANMPLRAEERLPRQEFDKSRSSGSRSKGVSGTLSEMAGAAGKLFKKATDTVASSVNLEKAAGTAGSLWGTVTSGVSSIFGLSSSVASGEAAQSLSLLSGALNEPVDETLLQALWNVLQLSDHIQDVNGAAVAGQSDVNTGFLRVTPNWKVMGWQKDDPLSDLKTTGTLALRCMLHMGSRYVIQTQDMLTRNKINQKSKYPFAIVGVNITLLLADILQLKDCGFTRSSAPFWELFTDSTAFYELFSICFMFMDQLWIEQKAVRADFGKLIAHIKDIATKVLARGPKSLSEFRKYAVDEGLLNE